nr:hypothetical protein HmN_000019200 [Hymenolepis microstoma]
MNRLSPPYSPPNWPPTLESRSNQHLHVAGILHSTMHTPAYYLISNSSVVLSTVTDSQSQGSDIILKSTQNKWTNDPYPQLALYSAEFQKHVLAPDVTNQPGHMQVYIPVKMVIAAVGLYL